MVNRLLKRSSGQRGGVSLVFVLFVVLIFSTLAGVGVSILTTEAKMVSKYVQGHQAYYNAEAGAEYGIALVFSGQTAPYSETVSLSAGTFSISLADQDSVIRLVATGGFDGSQKKVEVLLANAVSVGDFAIYATGEVTNVTTLDDAGDPDPSLLVENAPSLPTIDDSTMIAIATSQGHVYTVSEYNPSHGYPNFNFYYSGSTPNITYVQGDLRVQGGRTVYGIFLVEGDIKLDGSSRVEGVLYMMNPNSIIIHGGGSPTQSSVTGGIVANGNVDGTGNHITVHYNSEYMGKFAEHQDGNTMQEVLIWRQL